jgi:haloalkane dehalogenase
MGEKEISAEFPFPSKYIEILGSKIHYIDVGEGDPVLYLHGNPTSSYLWRNVIPHMIPHARCIAMDLIGFGKSDKPDIGYRIKDHYRYVEGFIDALGLNNLTLVIHDWGSALGFHYAMQNENNVKGIAFMEAIIKSMSWDEMPADFRMGFKMFRTPLLGWLMIVGMNVFVKQLLPQAIVRKLTAEEKKRYLEPFKNLSDRKPLWIFPNEIPIEGKPADVDEMVSAYNIWLQGTDIKKLLFHAHPGGIITSESVKWCRDNLKNLEIVDIGPGIHYLQEDNPHLIGEELARWYKGL